MDEDEIKRRQEFVDSAKKFLEAERINFNKVLEQLNLTTEELLKTEAKTQCQYNKDHIMPGKNLHNHSLKCQLLSAGYQEDELPSLLQDADFFYENAPSIMKIIIDENNLNKITWDHCIQNGRVYTGPKKMPASYIDENILLTQEDRVAVYQYVVKTSHDAGKVIPVDRNDELLTTDWGSLVKKGLLDEQNNKQFSSKLEQLAALRDLKRRRQSYRAKNVHITKKSYTEIIREVISNQMEILVPDRNVKAAGEDLDDASQESKYKSRTREERDRRREYSPQGSHRRRDNDRSRNRSRDRSVDKSRNRSRDHSVDEKFRKRSRDRSEDEKYRKGRKRSRERYRDRSSSPIKSKDRRHDKDMNVKVDKPAEGEPSIKVEQGEDCTDNSRQEDPNEDELRTKDSASDSDASSRKKSKHRKSKHKKKHSKKHKKKD
ncbi:U11/U12 small nuclear ribonucleoprotein 48 kDa protein-like [Physella acuta]|uniref:U11/U12 small nuclear ribonucleoprotein 48 kDa protein-like n=1 Tax=Physella acuta TaxID=109671 RepID=UPI0027DCB026|nr:U11/U12 small nuclear ribonucleoprotein 48 kDa protein-like [Physella acuta]